MKANIKKSSFVLMFLVLFAIGELAADDKGKLIFEDSFERSESQQKTDEPGNGWGTNSKSRAQGHKQVDLRDGAMYIFTHDESLSRSLSEFLL